MALIGLHKIVPRLTLTSLIVPKLWPRLCVNRVAMSKKSYSRAGVEDSVHLAAVEDEATWARVEAQYGGMMEEKGGKQLVKLDEDCEALGQRLRTMEKPAVSKDELLLVVKWKFGKGKPRRALMQYLQANTENQVNKCSSDGFVLAGEEDVPGAVKELSQLKGVGPATASAVLSLYRPELFSFMDDEIIECLYNGKRGYTLPIYMEVNNKCRELAGKLGQGWTPRRVGRALWTVARIKAKGGNWQTVDEEPGGGGATSKRKVLATKEDNNVVSKKKTKK